MEQHIFWIVNYYTGTRKRCTDFFNQFNKIKLSKYLQFVIFPNN